MLKRRNERELGQQRGNKHRVENYPSEAVRLVAQSGFSAGTEEPKGSIVPGIGQSPFQRPEDTVMILGVRITDITRVQAIEILTCLLMRPFKENSYIYFGNANTLRLALRDKSYYETLSAADYVFADGIGMRLAARFCGVRLKDNVNGTDLVPALLSTSPARRFRYFLLGADESVISGAANFVQKAFPNWTLAGFHHGYLTDTETNDQALRYIRKAAPDLLLVGMGNPLQEKWLQAHRNAVDVPVSIGVGGLFHYWSGDLRRAPYWMRRSGLEWLNILMQQPRKIRRYLLGTPIFLRFILRDWWLRRRQFKYKA